MAALEDIIRLAMEDARAPARPPDDPFDGIANAFRRVQDYLRDEERERDRRHRGVPGDGFCVRCLDSYRAALRAGRRAVTPRRATRPGGTCERCK